MTSTLPHPPLLWLSRTALLVLLLSCQAASQAGPLRDLIKERRAARQQNSVQPAASQDNVLDEDDTSGAPSVPEGVRVLRNISYGNDTRQRMDVYLPRQQVSGAPVILMAHGGGWRRGDKGASNVVENKVARWVTQGFIFVSTNYRMLPKSDPLEQAKDVARAIAAAQSRAASWGGDSSKFILMGHSAGAHLVALLDAGPSLAANLGAKPWLGTVALDGATLDVPYTMEHKHFRLHDQAFGTDQAFWQSVSPWHQLTAQAPPLLAVCSTRRADSCDQAARFVSKASTMGVRARESRQDKTHGEINQQLGQAGAYTEEVETFMASLDPSVARLLQR
jgi:arylformamidase